MRQRSTASSKVAKARSRKAKTLKAVRHRRSLGSNTETEVARLTRERDEALERLSEAFEQQTATSDVLRVISGSPGDLQPVFGAMLANATRLCEADFGILFLTEADAYRVVALHGAPPAFAEARRREPLVNSTGNSALARVVRTKQVIQVLDVAADPAYQSDEQRRRFVKLTGARTIICVPMLKENELIGAIAIYRTEVRP